MTQQHQTDDVFLAKSASPNDLEKSVIVSDYEVPLAEYDEDGYGYCQIRPSSTTACIVELISCPFMLDRVSTRSPPYLCGSLMSWAQSIRIWRIASCLSRQTPAILWCWDRAIGTDQLSQLQTTRKILPY